MNAKLVTVLVVCLTLGCQSSKIRDRIEKRRVEMPPEPAARFVPFVVVPAPAAGVDLVVTGDDDCASDRGFAAPFLALFLLDFGDGFLAACLADFCALSLPTAPP